MKKRIVSFLLSVIMVISLLPATVLAEEITFGDLFGLIGEQKFINSSGVVLRFAQTAGDTIATIFDRSMFTMTPKKNKVSVTQDGYHLVIRTSGGRDNVFDFYVSGNAFTKVVVSGMEEAKNNDEYSPYNPAADYSAVTDAIERSEALNASDYTSDSWQALQDAINGVIYDLDADHQADVDTMALAIMDAIDALEAHTAHDFTGAYKDNGDGTHARKCTGCDQYGSPEAHSYTDGVCICGAKDPAAELEEAKEAAISAIQEAAGDDMPTSLSMVVWNCATAISQATTVEEVNAARDAGIKSIQDELSKELTAAQKAALSAVQEAAAGNRSANVNKILISCKSAINRATTVEEVNAARDDGIKSIQDALAAAELDTAKKNAIAEINAKKNDENASVVDDAIAAIENAASVAEVTNLLNQASSELDDLEAAKQRDQYKERITNELLPAAECDEAREILNKALADLDNAETVSDLDSIMNNAEEAASDKDDEFRDWRLESNLYFKDALTDAATDETKAFVTELEQALADATSIAQVKDIFNNNKSTIDFYCKKDNAIAFLNECISSDESSDDMKAIARECLSQIKTATTMDEFNAIAAEFEPRMELQEAKDDLLAECNETLTSGEFSDETKSLIQDMMEEVKAAETIDEFGVLAYKTEIIFECGEILSSDEYSDEMKNIVQKICDEIMTATTAVKCDEVMEKYGPMIDLQFEKDEAREEIKELLPENASDAVKKIVSDACDAIQACGDPSKYDEIIENAKTAVEAQLQKEAELAPIKEAAKKAIDDAVPADASDEVKAAAEKAKADIDKANSVEDVNAAKESGINAIKKQIADEEVAAKEKAQHKETITNELLPAAKCDEAREILNQALADLDNAVTRDDVNRIFNNARGAANGKDSEFEGKRSGHTNAFNSALTKTSSDETKAFVAEMKQALADATSIAQVEEIYNTNKDRIGFCLTKDGYLNGLSGSIDSDEHSDAWKAIAQEYYNQVKAAATMDELNEIRDKFSSLLGLQTAKDESIAAASEVLTSDEESNEMKTLAQDYIEEVKAAETMDELEEIWDKYSPLIELQYEKDDAREEVKELLPENASDAVKKIISDACDEIQANDDPDQYAEIVEAASKAVEAQIQKEKELAPAKEAAIAEINDAKTDANASVAEDAIKAINNAQSEDEISTIKEQALTDMAAADAAAELAAAKEEAKKAILAEQGDDTSKAVAKAVEAAIAAIDAATTVDETNAAMEDGIAAIKDAKAGNVPTTPVAYTILDGANSVWTKGSTSGLVVRSDAPFAKFVGVKVDGKTIAATNYTAKEGSTIVTLTPAYLKTLKTGKHSIEIVSTDGSASTNFTVKAADVPADPQTGDNNNILIWALLFTASSVMLTGTAVYNRKRKMK